MAIDPMMLAMMQQGNIPTGSQPQDLTPEQMMQLFQMLASPQGGGIGQGQLAAMLQAAGAQSGGGPPGIGMPPGAGGPQVGAPSGGGALPSGAQGVGMSPQQQIQTPPSLNTAGPISSPVGLAAGGPPSNGPQPGGNLPPELLAQILGQGTPSGNGPPGGPISQNQNQPAGIDMSTLMSGGPNGPQGGGPPPPSGASSGPPPTTPPKPADVNVKTPAQTVAEDDSKLWLDALQRMTQVNAEGINGALSNSFSNPVGAVKAARGYDPGKQTDLIEQLMALLSRKAPSGGPPGGGGGPPGGGPPGRGG